MTKSSHIMFFCIFAFFVSIGIAMIFCGIFCGLEGREQIGLICAGAWCVFASCGFLILGIHCLKVYKEEQQMLKDDPHTRFLP